MMSITLYRGSKTDNAGRLALWDTLAEQTAYFDSLPKHSETVQTRRLGEPVRLSAPVSDLLQYTYGHIDYGDGFRYYFSIADLAMVSEEMTEVSYMLDCYETLVMQRPFQWGRAMISRYPMKLGKSVNPYTPTYRILQEKSGAQYRYCTLLYIRRDDTGNADRTYYGIITTDNDEDALHLFDGTWFDWFEVGSTFSATPAQIVVANVVAGRCNAVNEPGFEYNTAYEFTDPTTLIGVPLAEIGLSADVPLTNDGMEMTVLRDMRGLDVFVPEEGTEYTPLDAGIGASASTFKLIVRLEQTGRNGEIRYITIPMEQVMMFGDNWQEYNYRQRAYDMESRDISMNKALANGLINTASSALSTAAFGPLAKGASAKAMGGMAAGGSLISTLGAYAVEAFSSPIEQAMIDRQQIYANDSLTMVGDFTFREFKSERMGRYTYTTDASVNYEDAIAAGGYPVSIEVSDFGEYMNLYGPIRAEVECEGVPVASWKEQIAARFRAGVKVV